MLISLCKTCDPWDGAILGARCIICTNLVEVYQVMLHTKCQDPRQYGFGQEDFFMFFPILAYVKHVTPGLGPFLAPVA